MTEALKAFINRADLQGETALHLACKQNDLDCIAQLLTNGANKMLENNNKKKAYDLLPIKNKLPNSMEEKGRELLFKLDDLGLLCWNGNNNKKKIMIATQALVEKDFLKSSYEDAVCAAVYREQKLILPHLLHKLSQLDAELLKQFNVDNLLDWTRDKDIFMLLINEFNYKFPLRYCALHEGCLELAKELIDNRSRDVNQEDAHGNTPLYYALTRGNIPMIKLLFDNQANFSIIKNKADIYNNPRNLLEVQKLLRDRGHVS